jgi:hypothetical protein
MKRVGRPPTVDGMSVEDFSRANADPIVLHQEEMLDDMEMEPGEGRRIMGAPVLTADGRERVSFISLEDGMDLVVAFAVALDDYAEIASLILQRTPKFEFILPPDERGVAVSHELHFDEDRDILRRIMVSGPRVDIETTRRSYRLDVSKVDAEEIAATRSVLKQMHAHGGFELHLK